MGERVIALCSNIRDFDLGHIAWNDPEVWQKYPGSGWVKYFDSFAQEEKLQVLSGMEAFCAIKNGEVNPKDILIVQEEENPVAQELMRKGAQPSVLFCLESPLYAPFFYDHLSFLKEQFPYQILFGQLGNVKAYFPSYDQEKDLKPPIPWDKRTKLACLVMSNKHYSNLAKDPRLALSDTFEYALCHQLHDLRYQIIEKFVKEKKSVDLYGHGWDFAPVIAPGKKIEVLRDYKFCFCIENLEMPGYVTEKVIDALVAGCVPLYKGAPDFMAGSPFPLADSPEWIQDILDPKNDALSYSIDFERCQKYVRESDEFRKFSYQHFAKTVLDCVLKTL